MVVGFVAVCCILFGVIGVSIVKRWLGRFSLFVELCRIYTQDETFTFHILEGSKERWGV